MKKIFTILCLIFLCNIIYAQKYHGEISLLGGTVGITSQKVHSFNLTTSNGVLFNDQMFLGINTGLVLNVDYAFDRKSYDSDLKYLDRTILIPLGIVTRYYLFPVNSKICIPFIANNLNYEFNTDNFKYNLLTINPEIGIRMNHETNSIPLIPTISVGYSARIHSNYANGFKSYDIMQGITFKIALSW